MKSGGHYKFYVSPTLEALDSSQLGVWLGPINVSLSTVTDDVLFMPESQNKLQVLLDIASQCGKMFKIEYGTTKTKITLTGPEIDRQYYQDVQP